MRETEKLREKKQNKKMQKKKKKKNEKGKIPSSCGVEGISDVNHRNGCTKTAWSGVHPSAQVELKVHCSWGFLCFTSTFFG